MADDNSARYRSNDSFDRGPAEPASDPLAELARLIGQNDPYTGQGRDARPPAPEPAARYAGDPIPSFLTTPAPRYENKPAPASESDPAPRYSVPAPQQYDHNPVSGHSSAFPTHNDWPGATTAEPEKPSPAYPSRDFVAQPPSVPPRYASEPYASPAFTDPHDRPGDFYPRDLPGFDASGNQAPPDQPGYGAPLYPYAPDAGTMPPPSDDEFYGDEPRGGRRKGLLTVVAVLALAVVGTAGAFGYRSLFGSQGSSGPPPVIRASGEPSKVAPPPVTPDQAPGKFSYDRFGDAGKDEQVVRREEKPLDLSKVAAPPPRTVLPAAPFANAPAPRAAATANPPSALGEPRRVRTVPIRPDQGGDVASVPPSQTPMSAAPPRQTNTAAPSAPATRPADVAQAPDEAPRASARATLRSPPAAAPAANAPLSLSPAANNSPPPPAAQGSLPTPRAITPPARVASAPASGGSYLVQVSSQRSEADAETAYRGIQSKYSSVLGSQAHTVRRADLGTKGVYYRAMVGPFASREEALQLCSSLKQAGGDCVVQH